MTRTTGMVCSVALWCVAQAPLAGPAVGNGLAHIQVYSADGLPLNVVESGNPSGEPLLLLHGFSQSYLSWLKQLDDPRLQTRFRIVAMDLRGHGGSGKPWASESYAGHKVWADDIQAVIQQLKLERPWIVGWSFGGYVAMDFVREYGEAATRGVLLVGSHGGLLPRPAGEPAALVGDLQKSIDASLQFMNFMAAKPLPDEVIARGRYAYVMMPDYARRAMKAKRLDNTDLIDKLTLPMRFILGAADPSVPLAQVRERLASKPSIDLRVYDGVGHSAFIEAPDRFNQDLIQFTELAGDVGSIKVPAAVRRYLRAVNDGDVEGAVAAFASDGKMHLQRGEIARGQAAIREIERFHEIARPDLAPQNLQVRQVGKTIVVGYSRSFERSAVFAAMGLPRVATEAEESAFVVENDRLLLARQPAFTPACQHAMGAAMAAVSGWLAGQSDTLRSVLLANGVPQMNATTLAQWLTALEEWRATSGWSQNEELAKRCANGE